MTTKNMAYDHPAYQAVLAVPSGNLVGSGGTGTKMAAFTAMQVKAVQIATTVLSTSADVISVVKVTGVGGTNTTTSTTAYGTMGSGAYIGNMTPTLPANQVSLQQGDVFYAQKGTDATGTFVGMIELAILPLSNVTS
jgi:hypothetical protein